MNISEFTTAASDYAQQVDRLFALLSVISGLVVALVSALIIIFLARYHKGSRTPRGETPERFHREVEIGWTAATLFSFLFLFWWAASDQLTALTPPKPDARDPRRGEAMDVADSSIPAARARSTSSMCPNTPMCAWP